MGDGVQLGWSAPRFVSESHFTGTANNSGFDIGSPANIQIGDYLLFSFVVNKDAVTPDAAFTQIFNETGSAEQWQTFLYERVATSTDVAGTTYTWDNSNTTASPATAVILAFRDVDPGAVTIASTLGTTADPVTGPNVTTDRPSLIIQGRAIRENSATQVTFTGASGTERFDGGNNGASTSYSQAWYDSGVVSYTIGSNAGISIDGSSAPTSSVSYTIALGARMVPRLVAVQQSIVRASQW